MWKTSAKALAQNVGTIPTSGLMTIYIDRQRYEAILVLILAY